MAQAAVIHRTGGPEVIEWREVDPGAPGPGEVRMRHTAIGLNFIDTYHRRGVYPVEFPSGLGLEAAGIVEAAGEGVALRPGDRVVTFGPGLGAYCSARVVSADILFPIPDDIDDETAAAALLKGCTAEFLVERCARVQAGWPVLVQAAAGGVGLILVQWLKAIGATVIGTVGDADKAALALAAGADHIIFYRDEPIAPKVRALTDGAGVRVAFDGVGRATWEASLDSTGPRGLIVSYGNADAPVTDVALGILSAKGSLWVTRPTLFNYYVTPEERAAGADRLWHMIRSGAVEITMGQRYPLKEAARAHIDLEARKTFGSSLLLP